MQADHRVLPHAQTYTLGKWGWVEALVFGCGAERRGERKGMMMMMMMINHNSKAIISPIPLSFRFSFTFLFNRENKMSSHQPIHDDQDLDFIIGLSFYKLEQVTHSGQSKGGGGLLPFVLIRNALISQPPRAYPYNVITDDENDDSIEPSIQQDEAICVEEDLLKQEEEHIWLEACFDELQDDPMLEHQLQHEDDKNDDEEEDDSLMLDDFGDMMFMSAAKRAGIKPSYLSSSSSHSTSKPASSFHLTSSNYLSADTSHQQQQYQY